MAPGAGAQARCPKWVQDQTPYLTLLGKVEPVVEASGVPSR